MSAICPPSRTYREPNGDRINNGANNDVPYPQQNLNPALNVGGTGTMSSCSPFTLSQREASQLVRHCQQRSEDNRRCYLIQVSFRVVYGDCALPQSCYKKLPRLINGIPLGAGRLSQSQAHEIRWKYLEGFKDMQAFISVPLTWEEADETRRALKDCLARHAKAVFGDITVRTTVMLSQCLNLDSDFFVNDIADSLQEGLHFLD